MAKLYLWQQDIINSMQAGSELKIISMGRQVGKSYVNDLLKNWYANMAIKPTIKWKELPGCKLQAYTDSILANGRERGLNETDMDPIQEWCDASHCGRRMSFNVWHFKNRKHMTMFLIRWSS